jgi:hypothetical protein
VPVKDLAQRNGLGKMANEKRRQFWFDAITAGDYF